MKPKKRLNLTRVPLRLLGLLLFSWKFTKALVVANVQMAGVVLFRRVSTLKPGFLHYPVDGLSRFEILVLSHCITLTPGTTTVDVMESEKRLLVHALDGVDPEAIRKGIKFDLEEPLLAWTR